MMDLTGRARFLVVEIAKARKLPLMARAIAAERLTAEAGLIIEEQAARIERLERLTDVMADAVLDADNVERLREFYRQEAR